jgi:hypothetical protein
LITYLYNIFVSTSIIFDPRISLESISVALFHQTVFLAFFKKPISNAIFEKAISRNARITPIFDPSILKIHIDFF